MVTSDASSAAIAKVLLEYNLANAKTELINESENTTFRITPAGKQPPLILRIYRPNHRTLAEIASELDWMEAVWREAQIRTPNVIRTTTGSRVTSISPSEGRSIPCVVFEHLPGREPDESDLATWFRRLGALSARMHAHGRTWPRPNGFTRPTVNWESVAGATPLWGPWERASGLDASAIELLQQTARQIRNELAVYGESAERFGLIHGDLRLANLLVDADRIQVIDFDDCGQSWFLYDLATALSLLEHLPSAHQLVEAWLQGYGSVTALTSADFHSAAPLIMLRRIQVLSWFGSHPHADLTREMAPTVTAATLDAARAYASGHPPFRIR